jgi:hypothetical protein
MGAISMSLRRLVPLLVTLPSLACQDLSDYSTTSKRQYAGCVVPANFVLAGVGTTTGMCLTFDADQLQTNPGTITTSDGRFQATPLRPIPQLWNDPLSTLSFGEGRTKNLLYMATPISDAGAEGDITVVLSLMSGGNVEVRLLRSAPPMGVVDAGGPGAPSVFAVFPLMLHKNGCATLSATTCLDAG